ncbi:hypothetical protein ACRASX_08745 [Flavobacterium sp. TMP13]|uniref:hypothetical protein n=1 Tax=Flavobacterium sp. TMP13 TaxID=3425950 RepID=UPI003D771540
MCYKIANKSVAIQIPENMTGMIKVLGLGTFGINIINELFLNDNTGLDFIAASCSETTLQSSAVPNNRQLNTNISSFFPFRSNGTIKKQYLAESFDKIIDDRTKIIIVIAESKNSEMIALLGRMAKSKGILSMAIITVPIDRNKIIEQMVTLPKIKRLYSYVNALLIIDHFRIKDKYGILNHDEKLVKLKESVIESLSSIVTNITVSSADTLCANYSSINFKYSKMVLSDNSNCFAGQAMAKGENRANKAVTEALKPCCLLHSNIKSAKNISVVISSGTVDMTIEEVGVINAYIQSKTGHCSNIIMSTSEDLNLNDAIAVNILATGFGVSTFYKIKIWIAMKINNFSLFSKKEYTFIN